MNSPIIKELGQQRRIIYWKNLIAQESGEPFSFLKGTPVSVQFTGTFDGARVGIFGTNDVSEKQRFFPLNDEAGVSLVVSHESMETISQQCMSIRPEVFDGSTRTKISVYVFVIDVM